MWLFYALVSAVFASLVAIFAKVGIRGISAEMATTVRSFIMFVVLAIFILFTGRYRELSHNISGKTLLYLIMCGVAGAISWLAYFFALKNGSVAKVMSIDRLSLVFGVVLATIFLNEKMNAKTISGTIIMVIGAILIALA